MNETKLALKVNDLDNVATVFSNGVQAGDVIELKDKKGGSEPLKVLSAVPYGHKVAVKDIAKGELIMKYGEEIGMATADIVKGDYVHIHNLDSMRGRGDL